MSLISENLLKSLAQTKANSKVASIVESFSKDALKKSFESFDLAKRYDIFISHSYKDKTTVFGAKLFLELFYKYSTYVDWIDDLVLDRTKVTAETASVLKERMKNCNCLLYLCSDNSVNSKWMPWELGYYDGFNEKVAVLPLSSDNDVRDFKGIEYLGLYPYLKKLDKDNKTLILKNNSNKYIKFDCWLNGKQQLLMD